MGRCNGENGNGKGAQDDWPCVSCLSEALTSRAALVSEQELQRARRWFKGMAADGEEVIRGAAGRLARRIVERPLQRLVQTPPRDFSRVVSEIRRTFAIEEPDDCPIASVESDAPSFLGECPRRSPMEDI